MYWTMVAGYPMPKRIGGHPMLDFCDTYAGWNGPPTPGSEWLPTYDRFAVWTTHADLLTTDEADPIRELAHTQPDEAERVLANARDLRAATYEVLLDPSASNAFDQVAAYVREAAASALFVSDTNGIASWVIPPTVDLTLPLRRIAQAAGELLSSPDRTIVRACPGDDCGWLFLDRRGRRRWCSMATCGNRAKARAFGQRHRP